MVLTAKKQAEGFTFLSPAAAGAAAAALPSAAGAAAGCTAAAAAAAAGAFLSPLPPAAAAAAAAPLPLELWAASPFGCSISRRLGSLRFFMRSERHPGWKRFVVDHVEQLELLNSWQPWQPMRLLGVICEAEQPAGPRQCPCSPGGSGQAHLGRRQRRRRHKPRLGKGGGREDGGPVGGVVHPVIPAQQVGKVAVLSDREAALQTAGPAEWGSDGEGQPGTAGGIA
jgi:hypothetical protein